MSYEKITNWINKIIGYYYKIPSRLRNKYFITTIIFLLLIFFFDNHNIIRQITLRRELKNLKEEVVKFQNEYEADKKLLKEIKTDRSTLEKIGREKYLMHYKNDEIFYIKQ